MPAGPPSIGSATSPKRPRPSWPASAIWCSPARPSPVAFFAYPGTAERPGPPWLLASIGWPIRARTSLEPCWTWRTGSPARRASAPIGRARPPGRRLPAAGTLLNAAAIGAVIGARLPEGAVIVDEAITASLGLAAGTAGAPPHDWLSHTGGAIGQGLPVATGAAVASPGRRTVCVEADGSAMYTIQALWTQARESLDVTTVMISNRAYGILQIEMHRVQADPPGPDRGRAPRPRPARPRFGGRGPWPRRPGRLGDHRRGAGRRLPAVAGDSRAVPDRGRPALSQTLRIIAHAHRR